MKEILTVSAVLLCAVIFIGTHILQEKISIQMKKNNKTLQEKEEPNGFFSFLLGMAAVVGGVWLLAKVAKKGEKVMYRCPKCNSDIEYKQEHCNVCKSKLKWEF